MAMKPLPTSPFRKTCETCLFWIKSERDQYYPTEQGGVIAVKDISAKNLPPGAVQLGLGKIELAPCAVAPQWAHTKPDHWCWQHSYMVGRVSAMADIKQKEIEAETYRADR